MDILNDRDKMKSEFLKEIDGYPDYWVSNIGNIYSTKHGVMLKIEFNSAGRPTNLSVDNAGESVKDFLDYFDKNEYGSELIRAVNTLDDINRTILGMYVRNDLNLTKTAKELHSSTQYLKKRLQQIITTVRDNIDMELLDQEMDLIHIQ